jgi:hypothetical protein
MSSNEVTPHAPSVTTQAWMTSGTVVSGVGLLLLTIAGWLMTRAMDAAGHIESMSPFPNRRVSNYDYIPEILTMGAVILFVFGLLAVATGLRRVLRHPKA